MVESVDYKDPELWKKLIQSRDLKDKKLLNSIVVKIIDEHDKSLLDQLLASGYKIEVLNDKGQTALHHAFYRHSRYDVIQCLLENGANVNAVDSKGRTALHLACRSFTQRMLEVVKLLITNFNTNIEAKDQFGDTPLLSLFRPKPQPYIVFFYVSNVLPMFDTLLQARANIRARNNEGDTLLHLVIKTLSFARHNFYLPTSNSYKDHDHAKFVEQLLDYDSEFLETRNIEGKTPLQLALSMASADIVKVLLDRGADVNLIKLACENEEIFYYPKIVPQFEVVNNIVTIINLIVDRGFELSLEDNLVILKFLIHESDICECSMSENFENNMIIRVLNLLHCGTTQHAKKILSELRKDNANDFLSSIGAIWMYLNKVKRGHFYLDKDLEEILTELTLPYHDDHVALNEKELIHLQSNVKLKNGAMLYDLMRKHPYTTPALLMRDNFDYKLIDDFKDYEDIIKGHITKAYVRNCIVKSAYDYLPLSTLPSLPYLCNERILSFLSNVDIFNLCSSAIIEDSTYAVQKV